MAMFIRVKRKKTTYFLHCDPSETVLEIKQKLQALSDNPIDCQRLILLSSQLVLEDSKTLADQKVENDAIVALCLKTSDPRVHRIATGLRLPHDPKLYEKSDPPRLKPPPGGEVILGEDGQPLPLSPPAVLLERAMSTLLRSPWKPPPPTEEEIANVAADKEAAKLEAAKKKEDLRKQGVQKDTKGKKDGKENGKKTAGKKEDKKGAGKTGSGKKPAIDKRKGGKKKRGKDVKEEKVAPEPFVPPSDTGVWEDICIDRLTDYATLIDSD